MKWASVWKLAGEGKVSRSRNVLGGEAKPMSGSAVSHGDF